MTHALRLLGSILAVSAVVALAALAQSLLVDDSVRASHLVGRSLVRNVPVGSVAAWVLWEGLNWFHRRRSSEETADGHGKMKP